MTQVHHKVQLRYLLNSGPIGIGEAHTQPDAREFIEHLIDLGIVKRLFVEYPTGWQPRMNNLKTAITATPPNNNLATQIVQNFVYSQQFFCQTYPLPVLFAYALSKGVDVWCADHWVGGGAARFRTRHQMVQATFQRETQNDGPEGSIILFGSHHFDDVNNPLENYIPGLQYYNF